MTLKEVLELINIPPIISDVAIIAFVMSVIEISPIKINPWKWVKSFAEIPSKMRELEKKVDLVQAKSERREAHKWRTEILHFADSVRRNQLYSKETWDDTIDSIDNYNLYCKEHEDFRNGKTTAAMAYLNSVYAKALETPGIFLD